MRPHEGLGLPERFLLLRDLGGEMFLIKPDPGQDPRGAPDLMPIWNILDTTPEGRGKEWYPELEYAGDGR